MNKLDKYWDNIHLKYNSFYDEWLNNYLYLFNKDDLIVELGCGRAYCSKYLLQNGFNNVIASDFSKEVLRIVNKDIPNLKTNCFDMEDEFPYQNNSINAIIADLSLHYFDFEKTKKIFKEIHRVLKNNGYLIGRVNSSNDTLHIPNNKPIDKNFYFDGEIYKKFFDKEELDILFANFEVCYLEEKCMNRYDKPKVLWEFCIKKII